MKVLSRHSGDSFLTIRLLFEFIMALPKGLLTAFFAYFASFSVNSDAAMHRNRRKSKNELYKWQVS